MTNIHDELNRLTPEPDLDFLSRLDQQIQARIEQEATYSMITMQDNIILLFDVKRILLLAGIFLMVLLSVLLLLTISPSPEDDLSTSLIQTTPTVAAQDSCEVEPQSGWIVHIVTEDDTVETISQRYAVDSQELLDANCLSELEAGTQLFVPATVDYVELVPRRPISVGSTINDALLDTAYFPLPPDNAIPEVLGYAGTVTLKDLPANRPIDPQDVGFTSMEINGQTFTAEEGNVLLYWFGISEYKQDTLLYFEGTIQQTPVYELEDGTGYSPPSQPLARATAQARVVYNDEFKIVLEASIEDAILLTSFRLSNDVLGWTTKQQLTLSAEEISLNAEKLVSEVEFKLRVSVSSCLEGIERFLSCDSLPQDYIIRATVVGVMQPETNAEAETQVTVILWSLDAEVLKWALENNAEIYTVE